MTRPLRIALLIETSNAYGRGLLEGIVAFIRAHQPWSIYLSETGRGQEPPGWLTDWWGDGVIARIETPEIARGVRRLALPTVDLSAARLVPDLPWIETDDHAIAQLVIDHFLERGFRNFAFCGDGRFQWSAWREQAFIGILAKRHLPWSVYSSPGAPGSDEDRTALAAWLGALPKPVGVMAAFDLRGRQVIEACRDAHLPVPDEVAVVGVDNDALICELCDPPMSSVQPQAQRTGWLAAERLAGVMAGMMAGQPQPAGGAGMRVPPTGIISRRSTDVLALGDPDIAAVVRYIRDHACTGIDVGDILGLTELSRRVLEKRFRARLGCTPHEQILRVRFARVRELLTTTELPLSTIAERTGFEHVEYLSVAFKRRFGQTPSAFRQAEK